MSWKVKPSFNLPKGFELWEDAHFVELTHERNHAGRFLVENATPEAILQRCREYMKERGLDNEESKNT